MTCEIGYQNVATLSLSYIHFLCLLDVSMEIRLYIVETQNHLNYLCFQGVSIRLGILIRHRKTLVMCDSNTFFYVVPHFLMALLIS